MVRPAAAILQRRWQVPVIERGKRPNARLQQCIAADFFSERVFPPLVEGDYNFDGRVDAADYTLWRDNLATTADLRADGNLNGLVDGGDYDVWQVAFAPSSSVAVAAASVPEPAAALLMLVAGGLYAAGRIRRASEPRRR